MTEQNDTFKAPRSSSSENGAGTAVELGGHLTQPATWTCEQVGSWLVDCGLGQYRDAFVLNDVTGTALLAMDPASLANLVPALAHREQLMEQIERLTVTQPPRHMDEGVTGLASKYLRSLTHFMNDSREGAGREGVSGLLKGVGTGLSGAMHNPVEGMLLLSRHLGDGLRQTPDNIFGATASGTQGGSGGKPQFLQPHRDAKPSHVGEGVLLGLRRLGSGVYDGVAGLVNEPLRAASSTSWDTVANQRMAVAKGVAKGLTGALCCPLAGTLDLAHSTLEGLAATPHAIVEATKDGPALADTPTLRRLAGLQPSWTQGWGWTQGRVEGAGQGGESRGRVASTHDNND